MLLRLLGRAMAAARHCPVSAGFAVKLLARAGATGTIAPARRGRVRVIPTARIYDSLGDSQDGLNVIL